MVLKFYCRFFGSDVMGRRARVLYLFLSTVLIAISSCVGAQESGHLYVTWRGMEPDKGASAWYIKRVIDKEATFRVLPVDSLVVEGIPFDVPLGRYHRTHNASTMEMLLIDYPSKDKAVLKMAAIMRDIEINLWRPKKYPESLIIERQMRDIGERQGALGTSISCYLEFFDAVYASLTVSNREYLGVDVPKSCK